MKKMEELLPDYFMRIHRSYIINLTKIQEVNKNRVIMDADTYLPVGDLYKDAFQAYLNTKYLGKTRIIKGKSYFYVRFLYFYDSILLFFLHPGLQTEVDDSNDNQS